MTDKEFSKELRIIYSEDAPLTSKSSMYRARKRYGIDKWSTKSMARYITEIRAKYPDYYQGPSILTITDKIDEIEKVDLVGDDPFRQNMPIKALLLIGLISVFVSVVCVYLLSVIL